MLESYKVLTPLPNVKILEANKFYVVTVSWTTVLWRQNTDRHVRAALYSTAYAIVCCIKRVY